MHDGENRSLGPPLILIASAEEWSGRSLESLLTPNGFVVLRAHSAREAVALAGTTTPDAIILDERLQDVSGIELCRQLRTDGAIDESTGVIVRCESQPTRSQAIAAFHAGVWEVCHHPVDGELLVLRLQVYIRAKRALDTARDASLLDPHTGVYNMRGLTRRAREIAASAIRTGSSLACVAFAPDLDDQRGIALRADGPRDTLPAVLAKTILRMVRASDVVGHIGRSEFAVIATATDHEGAKTLIARVQAALAETHVWIGGEKQRLRVRSGYVAVLDYASTAVDALEMLERASSSLRGGRVSDGAVSLDAFRNSQTATP